MFISSYNFEKLEKILGIEEKATVQEEKPNMRNKIVLHYKLD